MLIPQHPCKYEERDSIVFLFLSRACSFIKPFLVISQHIMGGGHLFGPEGHLGSLGEQVQARSFKTKTNKQKTLAAFCFIYTFAF